MNGGSSLVRDGRLSWYDPELPRKVEHMRRRGYRGGAISTHHALMTSPVSARTWLSAIGLALGAFAVWLLLRYPISRAWAGMLDFWSAVIGLGGYVSQVHYDFHGLLRFDMPYLHFAAGLPSNKLWWGGLFFTLGLLVLPLFLPRRSLPLIYVSRVFALFQGGAQIYFALWPESFPYEGGSYVHGMLIASFMFAAITPLLLGFTYYALDFSPAKKVGLTVLLMGHLFLLIPIQYLAHAWVIHHLSLLFLPFVFFLLGLPLQVLTFVAFYAWGMSWRSRLREADAWWEARRAGRNGNGHNGSSRNGHGHGSELAHGQLLLPGVEPETHLRRRGREIAEASRIGRTAVGVALLAALGAAGGAVVAPAGDARAAPPLWFDGGTVEAGGSFSSYSGDLGDADAQFVRLTVTPEETQQWRFELAHENRFRDASYNFGLLWTQLLGDDKAIHLGASTGTGDYIAPEYRLDAGLSFSIGDLIIDPNLTWLQSKAENRSVAFTVGVRRYSGPWLLAMHSRIELGEPGRTHSAAIGWGITYLVWRRTHIGVGTEWGDVSYLLVGPDEVLVDYNSHAYHLALTQWLVPNVGLNLRFDYADTPFYATRGATLSLFREW